MVTPRWLLACLLSGSLAGCSGGCSYLGRPVPTDRPVQVEDIAGEWQYHTDQMKIARITLRPDGTFRQLLPNPVSGEIEVHDGTWSLDGASIELVGFYETWSFDPPGTQELHVPGFYVTTWYTSGFAPFGGDSGDPDIWEVWSRVQSNDP